MSSDKETHMDDMDTESQSPQGFSRQSGEEDSEATQPYEGSPKGNDRQITKRKSRFSLFGSSREGPIPLMGERRPYPPKLENPEMYKVSFDGPDDPLHPFNLPVKKKVFACFILGWVTFSGIWGSSAYAPAALGVQEEFHIGEVTSILGLSLYVLGFASGPVLWGPLSELVGRRIPFVVACFLCMVFTFAAATAKDVQTLMLTRFFAGFTAAASITIVPSIFADLFDTRTRGKAISVFGTLMFTSPILAPVAGGFISFSSLGWRWTEYLTAIFLSGGLVLAVFFAQETYYPVILQRKAAEIRQRTGNNAIYAPHDLARVDLGELFQKYFSRPIVMLLVEPILFLLTLYMAFIYGLMYLLLEAYPIIFGPGGYNFYKGTVELPYLSLFIGMVLAEAAMLMYFEPRYVKKIQVKGLVPEERLPSMIVGAFLLPIGIFWLTWSGHYHEKVHFMVPSVSGVLIGASLIFIFMPGINYIIDTYLIVAASAMAATTILRSVFGACFPLFAPSMFHRLGTNWAGTVLGCISVVMVPVPILFFYFGHKIRTHSRFAVNKV
jgi:DHA1 family multidrug resistance protein-like MFS transporter